MEKECAIENRLWITEGGGIAMSVGGNVIVQSISDWHSLRAENERLGTDIALQESLAHGYTDEIARTACRKNRKTEGGADAHRNAY